MQIRPPTYEGSVLSLATPPVLDCRRFSWNPGLDRTQPGVQRAPCIEESLKGRRNGLSGIRVRSALGLCLRQGLGKTRERDSSAAMQLVQEVRGRSLNDGDPSKGTLANAGGPHIDPALLLGLVVDSRRSRDLRVSPIPVRPRLPLCQFRIGQRQLDTRRIASLRRLGKGVELVAEDRVARQLKFNHLPIAKAQDLDPHPGELPEAAS